jgi:hypothetical protein
MKTIAMMSVVCAMGCAVDHPAMISTNSQDVIVDPDYCDPEQDWDCGWVPLPYGGGADIANELFAQSLNQPSALGATSCLMDGLQTVCAGIYANGYIVRCRLQTSPLNGIIVCSYTPGS